MELSEAGFAALARLSELTGAAIDESVTAWATLLAQALDRLDKDQLEQLRCEFVAVSAGVSADVSVSGFAEMVAIAMLPALNARDKWVLEVGRKVIAEDADLLERLA